MKTDNPWTDPIVDEVHRVRQELVQEAGGTLAALGEWLMKSQEQHGAKLVPVPPRRARK